MNFAYIPASRVCFHLCLCMERSQGTYCLVQPADTQVPDGQYFFNLFAIENFKKNLNLKISVQQNALCALSRMKVEGGSVLSLLQALFQEKQSQIRPLCAHPRGPLSLCRGHPSCAPTTLLACGKRRQMVPAAWGAVSGMLA